MGSVRFQFGIDDKPVYYDVIDGCDSRHDLNITGDVVGRGYGGTCLFPAMYSGWNCFGCARADDDGE
jgi:hypothetical protein